VNVVAYLARVDLRRRWLTWVGIALLLGLTAGASLFALAGARRTASSYARFLRSVNPSTIVVISPAGLPVDEQRAAAVPGVASSRMEVGFSVAVLDHGVPRLTGPWPDLDTVGTFDGRFFDQDRFVATKGRAPNPSRADEVAVNELAAERLGFRVGQRLDLGTYAFDQISSPSFVADAPTPKVLTHATVVGIGRFPDEVLQDEADRSLRMLLTPAYSAPARPFSNYGIQGLVLDKDADVDAIRTRFQTAAPVGSIEFRDTEVDAFHAQQALRPLALALAVFGTIVAGASVVLTAQVLARSIRAGRDQRALIRALGASPAQLAAAAVVGPMAATVVGTLLAVAFAFAASPLMPLGSVRAVDPAKGFVIDWTVLGLGALVLVVALTAWVIAVAVRTSRTAIPRAQVRPSRAVAVAAGAGLDTPALVGLRFALEPRTDAPSSNRSVIAGAVVAVAALVSAITFGASLDRLVNTPRLYGWNGEAVITAAGGYGNIPLDDASRILDRDANIRAWAGATFGLGKLHGRQTPMIGLAPGSAVAPAVVQGSAPQASGEIVLGTATARELRVSIGDSITLSGGDRPVHLRVVGLATFPTIGKLHVARTSLGVGAWVAPELVPGANRDIIGNIRSGLGPRAIFVQFRSGTDEAAAIEQLRMTTKPLTDFAGLDVLPVQRPAEIVNSSQIGRAPVLFALALGLGALVSLALTLGSAVRRHQRDLALLKTFGCTRRQLAATVAWQASVTALIALTLGIPFGIVIGRWLWTLFAQQLDVVVEPSVSLIALVVIAVSALLAANAAGAIPGRRARRVSPARLLRSE
jgi:ABC-type lipoprotein release transport system permease subunit